MKEATLSEQDRQQIDALGKQYAEAANNNDAAAVAALFTEDAVFVTESGPFYGRQAIEKFHADVYKEWHHSNFIVKTDPNSLRIIGTAENIALNGEWSQTLQGQTGGPIQRKGYWSAIDTRQGNDWKILMLTPNVTPEPATPAVSAETK